MVFRRISVRREVDRSRAGPGNRVHEQLSRRLWHSLPDTREGWADRGLL